jgi:hypothetical protein
MAFVGLPAGAVGTIGALPPSRAEPPSKRSAGKDTARNDARGEEGGGGGVESLLWSVPPPRRCACRRGRVAPRPGGGEPRPGGDHDDRQAAGVRHRSLRSVQDRLWRVPRGEHVHHLHRLPGENSRTSTWPRSGSGSFRPWTSPGSCPRRPWGCCGASATPPRSLAILSSR